MWVTFDRIKTGGTFGYQENMYEIKGDIHTKTAKRSAINEETKEKVFVAVWEVVFVSDEDDLK